MRVLVVDDSSAVRGRLAAMLREVPGVGAVDETADGESAVDLSRARGHGLVVLDLHLRGVGGLVVLPRLKHLARPPRVAVLTNETSDHHRRECLASGADYFFDKSRDFDRVLHVAAELSRRG
jgi:DNA-binding NarL/FixJ family response regulator